MKHKKELIGIGITGFVSIVAIIVVCVLFMGLVPKKHTEGNTVEDSLKTERETEPENITETDGFVSWENAGLQDHPMDWKDETLEIKMQDITGIYGRDIMLSDVWELTELDLSYYTGKEIQISDITALGELKNLRNLDLFGNNIYDIQPLSGLVNLELLNLSLNHVSDVTPLQNLTKLFNLELPGNEITNVEPLANLKNLTVVDLLGNPVTDYSSLSFVTCLMVDEEPEKETVYAGQDVHSIWVGTKEIKILQYLNEEKMVVKMRIGDYQMQVVVPRSMETEEYACDYWTDGEAGWRQGAANFVNYNKKNAIYIGYYHEDDLNEYEEMKKRQISEMGETESLTMKNGHTMEVLEEYSELQLSDEDSNGNWVMGKWGLAYDDELQTKFGIAMFDENDLKREKFVEDMQQMQYREWNSDTDYLAVGQNTPDYENRMSNMYQRCFAVFDSPEEYLKQTFDIDSDERSIIYCGLYDMTGDDIPEMLIADEEKGICILGENNSVRIPASDYLIRTDDPSMYYSVVSYTWGTYMTQYYITQTPEGLLEASEGKVLSYEPMVDDSGNETISYSWDNKEITQKEYDEMSLEINSNRHQVLAIQRECIGKLSKSIYYNADRRLTDEMLGE